MRAVFVGLTTLDLVHRVDAPVGPDEKVQALRQDIAAGGPAANAAVTFAALGGAATLVTALGRHPLAVTAAEDLRSHGVEILDATPGQDGPPPVSAIRVVDATGERSVSSVNDAAWELPGTVTVSTEADLVVCDGWLAPLALAAAEHGAPLLVGSGSWKPVLDELVPRAAAGVFRSDPPIRPTRWAVTDGPRPVRWGDGAVTGEVAPPRVTARDTLGAGDAFLGAAAYALAGGRSWPDVVGFATEVAALRVRHVGPRAWLAYLDDLERYR